MTVQCSATAISGIDPVRNNSDESRRCGIEIEDCARCGGKLKVIASIEEPAVIARTLAHLEKTAADQHQAELPLGARAPPSQARLR